MKHYPTDDIKLIPILSEQEHHLYNKAWDKYLAEHNKLTSVTFTAKPTPYSKPMKTKWSTSALNGSGTYGLGCLFCHHKDSFHHFFSIIIQFAKWRLTFSWTTNNKQNTDIL